MLKKGFTLAEVLISLGIIGIVAALTTPALMQSVSSSKVGPSLAKAVENFEKANQMMLMQEDANSITSLLGVDYTKEGEGGYGDKLTDYIKISIEDDLTKVPTYKQYMNNEEYVPDTTREPAGWANNAYTTEDRMVYYIFPEEKILPNGYANIPSNQKIGQVYVDINGYSRPNKQAKDIFRFYLYNDGTLRPYGGKLFDRTQPEDDYINNAELYWAAGGCDKENGAVHPDTCAGSVFDNNRKVIFEK